MTSTQQLMSYRLGADGYAFAKIDPVPTADNVPDRINRSVHITVIGRPVMSDQDDCAALARKWWSRRLRRRV